MALARYKKTPNEVKQYTIDYSGWLATGETILSSGGVTFSAPTSTESVVTNNLVILSWLLDGTFTKLSYFVGGGDDGATFETVVKIITTAGQTKEDAIEFDIRIAT